MLLTSGSEMVGGKGRQLGRVTRPWYLLFALLLNDYPLWSVFTHVTSNH